MSFRLVAFLAFCFGGVALGQSNRNEKSTAEPKLSASATRDHGPAASAKKKKQDRDQRRNKYPRRFDLRPQFYQDDYGYRFGVPAFDENYDRRTERAYQQGLMDGRHYERLDVQAERGFAEYRRAMFQGNAAFTSGKYGLAARQYLLAAALNQGDPASRLCAAHCQIALHDYGPAARLLRRAFELQPKLLYLPMDIRGAYGNDSDFPSHRKALRQATVKAAEDGDLWFVLGYVHYFSGNMAQAAKSLQQASELQPDDRLTAELASLARLSAGPAGNRSPKNPTRKEKD